MRPTDIEFERADDLLMASKIVAAAFSIGTLVLLFFFGDRVINAVSSLLGL